MANGICVYAENYNGKIEPVTAELISAAHKIKETTNEPIQAIVAGSECEALVDQLTQSGVDEIYAVKTDRDCAFQDDALSQVVAEMLKKIDPSSVLVPATPMGRSIFSRVAVKLNCGLTADCTELLVDKREDGSYYIKQNKPSFGENVFVTIVTKEGYYPQMMTVRPGVYTPYEGAGEAEVTYFEDISLPESKIEVTSAVPAEAETDSILAAEVVVVGGRGAEEPESFALLKAFADRSEQLSAERDRLRIPDRSRSRIRSDRQDLRSVRRSAFRWEYPEQSSIQKESKIRNLWLPSIQMKMPRSTILRIMVLQQI